MKGGKIDFDDEIICLMRYGRITDEAKVTIKDLKRADFPDGLRMIIEEL